MGVSANAVRFGEGKGWVTRPLRKRSAGLCGCLIRGSSTSTRPRPGGPAEAAQRSDVLRAVPLAYSLLRGEVKW